MKADRIPPISLVELQNEYSSCPAQWVGRTAWNRPVYVRFRWGVLTVYVGLAIGAPEVEYSSAEVVFQQKVSDDLDGTMSDDVMRSFLMPGVLKMLDEEEPEEVKT